jgi:prepilin-type N-terminal cleavage/methylation domain-containing protein
MRNARTRSAARRAGRGFSLIEILVVVAVLAVLLAILLPTLSRAKARARTAVCASNLRTLGLAAMQYSDQYGGNLPRYYLAIPPTDPRGKGRLWWFGFEPNGPGGGTNRPLMKGQSPLAPYTADLAKALQCPNFPYNDAQYFPKFSERAASYGYNLLLAPANLTQSASAYRFATRLSSVVAFADALHFDFPPGFNEAHYLQYTAGATAPSGYAHFRHLRQAQMVFLDAHVDTQSLTGPTYKTIDGAPTGNLAAENGSNTIYGF